MQSEISVARRVFTYCLVNRGRARTCARAPRLITVRVSSRGAFLPRRLFTLC